MARETLRRDKASACGRACAVFISLGHGRDAAEMCPGGVYVLRRLGLGGFLSRGMSMSMGFQSVP